jgi:hypothetical protein
LESFQVSRRCGWSPNAFQIHCTADCVARPAWPATWSTSAWRLGRGLERLDDDLLDLLIGDHARAPRPRLVGEPVEPVLQKPRAPLAGHIATNPQLGGDLGVPQAVSRQQHDPRPQRLRARAPPRPGLQLRALVVRELDRGQARRKA